MPTCGSTTPVRCTPRSRLPARRSRTARCCNQEYGNWEFAVRDRDGYLIAFGSDAGAG